MMVLFFDWGPFTFSVFTLSFVGAIILFLLLVYIEARRKRLPEQRIIDFMIILLLIGIPAGRLVYAALYDCAYFVEQPLRLFQLQDGGISFWGALAAVLIASYIWALRNRITLESYLETVAFAFPLAASVGILGIEQSGRMMATAYPWGIPVNNQMVHPVGAYRIALFMLMYFIIRDRRRRAYEGETFVWFIFGFSLIELGIDFFCDSVPVIWNFSLTQSCALIAIFFVLLFMLFGNKAPVRTSFSLLSYSRQRERKPGFITGMFWYLLLTGGLLTLYYWLHYSV